MYRPENARKTFAELGRTYTYSELTRTVDQLGGLFDQFGLRTGDRVVVSSEHPFILSSLVLAGLRYGITTVLVDPETGPQRAQDLFQTTTPRAYFVDESLRLTWALKGQVFSWQPRESSKGALFQKMLGQKKGANPSERFFDKLSAFPATPPPAQIDPETIGYILFTSGTTATSKAVQISHRAILANLRTTQTVYQLGNNSRIYNILTLYHTDGLFQGPILAAFSGGSWYRPLTFAVDQIPRVFDGMYKYRITHFITVPTMLSFMHQFAEGYEDSFQNPDFQFISCSAAPLDQQLWTTFEATFQTTIVNVYGLTETVNIVTVSGPEAPSRKVGTIGKPVDCVCRLVDPEGRDVPIGVQGEILIQGATLFSGYLNNDAANEAAFTDGWFRTGDLATQDQDGYFTLVGRKKNLVISGGINIQPEEVAQVLATHPDIREAACIGQPDPVFGEKLVAAVVLHTGVVPDESSLINHCRQELELAKVPREVLFVDHLPRTASGKVRIPELRSLLQNDQLAKGGDQTDVRNGLLACAAEAFNTSADDLDLSRSAENLEGWDSMAHLIFVTNLEKHFAVRFSSKEVMVMSSLQEALAILQKKLG